MLLQIQDGTLSVGGQVLLSHFDFEIKGNEKIAVIGKNGAGKSTFLRLLAGELNLDRNDQNPSHDIFFSRKITIGLQTQQAFFGSSITVEELIEQCCPCQEKWDRERFSWEQEYDKLFTGFGLKKEDKKKAFHQFSGGEQTKISLIRLLLLKPDLLLLDEPTNHLDIQSVEWLETYLKNYEKAVVIVSHDRFFLDKIVDTIWEIQDQKLTCYKGNYSAFRILKQKKLQIQKKAYKHQQEEIERLQNLVERFKHKPNKASFARSKKKILERMPLIEKPDFKEISIFVEKIIPENIGPKLVLEAEHLQIGYGETCLDLSLRIRRGQKIGIIGSNGAGKSTFLKIVAGLHIPRKGKCEIGQHVTIGYFDQLTANLVSEQSVEEHFHGLFPSLTAKELRSILGKFLFSGTDIYKKVSQLSGGEKSRLVLAELFQSRPNFLVLDEPTNHMDIPAKEVLESALRAYTGTLLFVSHDRYFIQQIADALLIFDKDLALYYPFGYEHYLEHCRKNTGRQGQMAQMRAEDQALLSSLQNIPKKEKHFLKEIPTDLAYHDWKMRLAEESLQEVRMELENFGEKYNCERYWYDDLFWKTTNTQLESLQNRYTQSCLDWYDTWLELHADLPPESDL